MTATSLGPAPADVLLADGSIAVIRPLHPGDGPGLHDLHEQVSDDAIRMRFFSVSRHAAHVYVDHVLSDPETLALVAERHGRLIGLATAEPMSATRYEVAFLVSDDARGHGVGTLLLEHLAALALGRGITTLEADVLTENHAMLTRVLRRGVHQSAGVRRRDCGPHPRHRHKCGDDGIGRRAGVPRRGAVAGSVAASGKRSPWSASARTAQASVPLCCVRSSPEASPERSWPCTPERGTLLGVPTYASISEVPGPVDLVVICVPAAYALDVFHDAVAAGVHAAVVVSSGFGELGAEGARMQHELAALARAHDVRVVGPNCLGLLLNHPDIRLNATFNDTVPPAGGLAVASQSGGVGIVLMDLAHELGLGVHTFVSLGNKADVSSNDLLAAWYDDPEVTAAALYLESFGNSAKFARFARRFARAQAAAGRRGRPLRQR